MKKHNGLNQFEMVGPCNVLISDNDIIIMDFLNKDVFNDIFGENPDMSNKDSKFINSIYLWETTVSYDCIKDS